MPEFGLCIMRFTYRLHSAAVMLVLIGRAMVWHLEHLSVKTLYPFCCSTG